LLKISVTTVISRIKKIAGVIEQPAVIKGKSYEVDELRTYIGNKQNLYWVVCALQKESGKVVSFAVGKRTNKTLRTVITTLLNSNCKKIATDGLQNYRYLVPPRLHKVKAFGTNRVERMNLNIRTHLKRLSRKTICSSKSIAMLTACLKIYFWTV
jgi:insertion element IS1 protein InsB